MRPTVLAPAILATAVALAGCASSSSHARGTTTAPSTTAPTIVVSGLDVSKIPTCQSLVGKVLPASAADSGCIDGSNIRVAATYTCGNGSALVAFPGETNQVYFWAAAGQPVRSASWETGNAAATRC